MEKPRLPDLVNDGVLVIKAETWNRLIDCLEYAMWHPTGDGKTITEDITRGLKIIQPEKKEGIKS